MAIKDLTINKAKGPYTGTLLENSLDVAWEAANTTEGNRFDCTGNELLFMKNDGSASANVTLRSEPDFNRRKGDITYSVGAEETASYWYGSTVGWADENGKALIETPSADIQFAIVRIE